MLAVGPACPRVTVDAGGTTGAGVAERGGCGVATPRTSMT
jgi:hypothetical protein